MMGKSIQHFRIFSIIISLALALLCGCKSEMEFNHWYKSGDSEFVDLDIPNSDVNGIKVVMVTDPDGYTNEAYRFNFVLGSVYRDEYDFQVFDSYISRWNFFPHIYSEDVDNDGEKEIIVEVSESEVMGNVVVNIYRHFSEAEFGEPYFLAIDEPIFIRGHEYEFRDGKLITLNEGNYKDGTPIPNRTYRIERYKIVMEKGDEDLRDSYFFLRPPRKEAEWLKLKKKLDANFKPTLDIRDAKDYLNINATQKWIKGIQSFRLDRQVEKKYPLSYLVATDSDGAIFMFDCVEGRDFEYKAFDINKDGKTELLVFYHASGNAYMLNIYSIVDGKNRTHTPKDIVKWEDVAICGNQYSGIKVEEGKITVRTHDYGSENCSGYLVTEYSVEGNVVKEIKKESFKYSKE